VQTVAEGHVRPGPHAPNPSRVAWDERLRKYDEPGPGVRRFPNRADGESDGPLSIQKYRGLLNDRYACHGSVSCALPCCRSDEHLTRTDESLVRLELPQFGRDLFPRLVTFLGAQAGQHLMQGAERLTLEPNAFGSRG